MKQLFLIVAGGIILAGCSVLGTPAAEKIADVVDGYCASEPYEQRQVYRDTINANTDGHIINVHCAGDPE